MKLSVVATLYQSELYIAEFYQRSSTVAKQIAGEDYELILVNDGSPDNSLAHATKLVETDNHVVVIDLSRNFGHHKAIMAGLSYAAGDLVFLIDSNLEEEPEWAITFHKQMQTENCDLIFGVQKKRKGNFFEQISGAIFYKIFRFVSGIQQPNHITTARLMSKRYTQALLQYQERELNFGGISIITGFKQGQQTIKKHASSPTTYSFSKKLSHFVNAITSFSILPLVTIFYSGIIISITALIYIARILIKYLFNPSPVSGYTSLIASIWLLSGLIIFFIGLQGIYIAKIFSEVKQRPNTIIRDIYRHKKI